ncbi:MAG TPA: glycosyltransferase family 4 protein [Pyrinomonadaceae bacterium]|nr:glycosyltransferase family 4 protein [Pyrinomonadaceae bacterium]
MKLAITSPNLDENKNVSGISTIVRQIIEHCPHEFVHFKAGREDGEPAGIRWMSRQALLPIKFYGFLRREKPALAHINTAMTDLSIWRDLALCQAAKRAGVPVVLALHGGKFLVNEFESPRVEKAAARMLRSAKTVVVYSELEKLVVKARWPGLDIRILANAVPVRDNGRAQGENDIPVIIFFGRLHESKGLDEMVAACAALKNDGFEFRFTCFGDGPMRDSFLPKMKDALGEGFHYGGVVKGGAKFHELEKADIFLLPSIYGEGLPMAMLEAMASGCVVVASEMASVAAVIDDGVNGYLVEPGNTAQLVSRMKMILSSRSEWKLIQGAAVKTVRNRFSIPEYVKTLESIYQHAAAS